MISCIIIEDQPPAQRILRKYVNDVDSLELKGVFSNAIEALTFLQTATVDLIFLDIHLPKISGMDFLKSISQQQHIILTTAFSEYALESYEFNVVDYLLKPFSFQRFIKAISRIPLQKEIITPPSSSVSTELRTDDHLYIKSGHDHIRILTAHILYIKSEADYTEVFTQEKKYLTANSLRYWLEKLDSSHFHQVHKSYIINTLKIKKVSGNQIFMLDTITIPIGRAYKEGFVSKYLK